MAEPVSSLPPTPEKVHPIPWPSRTQPMPGYESSKGLEDKLYRGREAAQDSWRKIQSVALRALSSARAKLVRMRNDRPLQVIAAAAAAGFVLGAVLRIWRSHHE